MEAIKQAIAKVCEDLFKARVEPELTRPTEQFGDYSTNIAMQLAKSLNKKPHDIAQQIVDNLKSDDLAKVEVAGPGFINFTLSDGSLASELAKVDADYGKSETYQGKTVVTEYSDPNPFKELHAGHLYTSIVGEGISRLFEAAGASVHRVNFGGDVGLHVARAMWGILQKLGGELPEKLKEIPKNEHAAWLSAAYVTGATASEENESIKSEIIDINKRIYQVHADNDHKSPFAQIYWICRQWSYDYFEDFYERIGLKFEKYYPESENTQLGVDTVKEQLKKGVFQESDGAIIFPGEDHDLHARVFINSQGLPTYEAKDVGLSLAKWRDYKFDKSVIITGNDIAQYMQVVLKAIEQFEPELAKKTTHLTHGQVKLKGGVKMSSRKGNVLRAVDVLESASEANKQLTGQDQPEVALGAVKYAFLKQGIGPDVVYDPEESVAVQGNSGPYLQYAHARAHSILNKSTGGTHKSAAADLDPSERSVVRKISEYPEVIQKAVDELSPHSVCTYLYELAQAFNYFYEHNRVIGHQREAQRLQLVKAYAMVLKNGLGLLNISAPERM